MAAWRARAGLAVRIAIAIAVVWWIVREAGVREIAETLRHANVTLLAVAFCFLALETITKAWNWIRVLESLGYSAHGGRLWLLRASLIAAFMGSLLPSTASTDALRVVFAQRVIGGRPSAHAASIVIQNALGWIASCSIGLVSIVVLCAEHRAPAYTFLAAGLFAGVISAGVGVYLGLKYCRGLLLLTLRRLFRRRWFKLRRAIRRFADALLVFERAHVRFAPRAGVAAVAALLSALVFAFVAASVGIQLPIVVWGMILPLISLFGLLPISISGLGGAQAVHVFLLNPFGVPVSEAFAMSALYAMLNLTFTLIFGSLAWVLGPNPLGDQTVA